MKGLYIHIPFCEHICHYCDFVKQVPKNDEMIDKYIDSLIDEIKLTNDIEGVYSTRKERRPEIVFHFTPRSMQDAGQIMSNMLD